MVCFRPVIHGSAVCAFSSFPRAMPCWLPLRLPAQETRCRLIAGRLVLSACRAEWSPCRGRVRGGEGDGSPGEVSAVLEWEKHVWVVRAPIFRLPGGKILLRIVPPRDGPRRADGTRSPDLIDHCPRWTCPRPRQPQRYPSASRPHLDPPIPLLSRSSSPRGPIMYER